MSIKNIRVYVIEDMPETEEQLENMRTRIQHMIKDPNRTFVTNFEYYSVSINPDQQTLMAPFATKEEFSRLKCEIGRALEDPNYVPIVDFTVVPISGRKGLYRFEEWDGKEIPEGYTLAAPDISMVEIEALSKEVDKLEEDPNYTAIMEFPVFLVPITEDFIR